MTLYSKNGSIPKPQTDGTDGWVEVPEAPVAGDGQEVVWWCPPGWVVRPTKPVQSLQTFNTYDLDGNITSTEEKMADWSWCQSEEKCIAYALPVVEEVVIPAETTINDTVTITDSAVDTITLSSAEPTISLDLGSDTVSASI